MSIDNGFMRLEISAAQNRKGIERLEYFISHEKNEFSRKDYMNLFKEISPATASRDLKKGVENGLLKKRGDKTKTIYKVIKK